ncbi:MAG: PEP-CTERM sorting domain-containing protein [Acidobacteriota bacterium]|nr:PEP-CTERM sorting domain-containing protein [Acidobacteriota bacterium]
MKFLASFLALVLLTSASVNLHADPIVSLDANAQAVTLVQTPVLGGEAYVYTNIYSDIFNTTLQTFTATFTDLLGVKLLNVTDVCAQVNIVFAAKPCQALAFSYTDASLGNATLLSALGTVGVNLTGDVAGLDFGASIGGGSAEIGFPGGPGASPVPEPGTLSLMATGLLSAAGVVRKRFTA